MDHRPPCRNFQNGGSCKYGDGCRFSHGAQGQSYAPAGYSPQSSNFRPPAQSYGPTGGGYPQQGGFPQRGGQESFGGGRSRNSHFSSNRPGNFQGPNSYQPGGPPRGPKPHNPAKPKSCFFYHRDKCTHANCRDLHQFTYQGDLTKTGRYELPGAGSSLVMITASQVAAAAGNVITVLDYQTQQVLAQLQTQCSEILLSTFTAGQMTFLIFAGNV